MSLTQFFKTGLLTAATGAALSIAAAGAASAQACPEWQLGGIPLTTDAETAWVPQQYPLFAGGALDLSACPGVPGVGYVTPAPNFTIQYDARNMGRDLEFRVETECDTTLLINQSNGEWVFNDDEDGTLQPRLRLANAPSGQYDVWVGSYSSQACQATLVAETFPPGGSTGTTPPAPVSTCPEWSLGGTEVNLVAGGTQSSSVVAGGPVDMFGNQCGIQAHGHITEAPNFSLYFDPQDADSTLTISADGECDTLILVNDPTTAWLFNDDANGLQPSLSIGSAQAGRYDIWVGTYGGGTCTTTFNASATGGAAAPSQGK